MTANVIGALSGNAIIAATWVFAAMTTIALALRIWARLLTRAWGTDDWLMLVAWALFFAQCAAAPYTHVGKHHSTSATEPAELTDAQYQEGKMWHFIIGLLYTTTTTLSKCSISCYMLRIAREKVHRWIFKGVIVLSGIACIVRVVYLLGRCKHLNDNWSIGQNPPVCASSPALTQITIFFSVVCIVTDFVCSGLPVVIVYKLQMNQKLKIYVIIMFGVGALASIATILRVPFLFTYQVKHDFLAHLAPIAFYSNLEGALAIIVACVATLRPLARPLSRFLPCLRSNLRSRVVDAGPYNAIRLVHLRPRSEDHSVLQEDAEPTDRTNRTDSQSHIIRPPSPAMTASDEGNAVELCPNESVEGCEVLTHGFV